MKDQDILNLYWQRSEQAITETAAQYGNYCYSIAYNILSSRQDSEESVNDTYLAAWNTIPPQRPERFSAFLGKITRHISLDRLKYRSREKRGGGEILLCLDELEDCISDRLTAEDPVMKKELLERITAFLAKLPKVERQIFVCRYWYLDSISSIAQRYRFSESKVSSMLHRTRSKLKKTLEKEGVL